MNPIRSALVSAGLTVFLGAASAAVPKTTDAHNGHAARYFTVKDDIGMSLFQNGPVFSPNNRYFYVLTERGLLGQNTPEDTITIWSTAKVERYLEAQEKSPPDPVVTVHMATYKNGPIITDIQWMRDSSGLAYRAATANGTFQLLRTRVKDNTTRALTPSVQNVTAFDYRSDDDYVYAVTSPEALEQATTPELPEDITGKPLETLLSLQGPTKRWQEYPYCDLWVVTHGTRTKVENIQSHKAVHLYAYGGMEGSTFAPLSLSPDGTTLALIHLVTNPPVAWEQYASPIGYDQLRSQFKLGVKQTMSPSDDLGEAFSKVNSYQLLNLSTGAFTPLIDAPTGHLFEWDSQFFTPQWSDDGQSLVLPDSFLSLDVADRVLRAERSKHPCIVVVDVSHSKASCVLPIVAGADPHRYAIDDLHFERGIGNRLVVSFNRWGYLPTGTTTTVFVRNADGVWAEAQDKGTLRACPIDVTIRESLNDPPVLVVAARSTGVSRLLWNPNPQLDGMKWGEATLLSWTDTTGWKYNAALVLPPDYVPGRRYPLVIQSHGFSDGFLTSGAFPSGFCARELAAVGIVVVQMNWNPKDFGSTGEADNQVAGYESLVDKLARDGLVDPDKVGMIGFSRTVYHTYAALVSERPRLAAASVIDGINGGYWQYLMTIGGGKRREDPEKSQLIGARPVGDGLQLWMKRSPTFDLNLVRTPLLMLEPGREQILQDWEPYSILYSLHRPVDMILIPSGEHVESNPRQRLASQGINVDWFRFWLQGYEDPTPLKKERYIRWRALKASAEQPEKLGVLVGSASRH